MTNHNRSDGYTGRFRSYSVIRNLLYSVGKSKDVTQNDVLFMTVSIIGMDASIKIEFDMYRSEHART